MNVKTIVKSEYIRIIVSAIILSVILFISMIINLGGNWIMNNLPVSLTLYFLISMLLTALFIRKLSILIPISIGILAGLLFYSYELFYISITSEPNEYIDWGLVGGISFIFGTIFIFGSAIGMILSNYIRKFMKKN